MFVKHWSRVKTVQALTLSEEASAQLWNVYRLDNDTASEQDIVKLYQVYNGNVHSTKLAVETGEWWSVRGSYSLTHQYQISPVAIGKLRKIKQFVFAQS